MGNSFLRSFAFRPAPPAKREGALWYGHSYSHSMVPGGFEVTS